MYTIRLEIEKQSPYIIELAIKFSDIIFESEIVFADHSRIPHPFIEKGNILTKFKKTEQNKSKKEIVNFFKPITWTSNDKIKRL